MVGDRFLPDSTGVIATTNGSSCVPIAPNWCLTARHVWPQIDGEVYSSLDTSVYSGLHRITEIVWHEPFDVALCRVDRPFARYHRPASRVPADGEHVVLSGWGRTGPRGQIVGFPRLPLFGTNIVRAPNPDGWLSTTYDAPGPASTDFECAAVENDSGGGLLIAEGNELRLAGFAISSSNPQICDYGCVNFFENVGRFREWIDSVIQPSADYNADGAVTISDVWAFVDAFTGHQAPADFNRDGVITIQDYFDFLSEWFKARGTETT